MSDIRRYFDDLMKRQQAERGWLEARARQIKTPTNPIEQIRSLERQIDALPDEFVRNVEAETQTPSHKEMLRICLKRTRDAINAGRDFRPEWLTLHDAWQRANEDYREWRYHQDQYQRRASGGKARKGSVKAITATIRAMLEVMDDRRADAVLAEMAADAAGRGNVLTGIREYQETVYFTSVTAERIEYVDPNGKPGSMTRKRLGNAISQALP